MSSKNKIRQLSEEISAYRFRSEFSKQDYEWLISKCKTLTDLLREDKAPQALIKKMDDAVRYLEEQDRSLTHELVREQILIFQQDAIVFYLAKQGYIKIEVC